MRLAALASMARLAIAAFGLRSNSLIDATSPCGDGGVSSVPSIRNPNDECCCSILTARVALAIDAVAGHAGSAEHC